MALPRSKRDICIWVVAEGRSASIAACRAAHRHDDGADTVTRYHRIVAGGTTARHIGVDERDGRVDLQTAMVVFEKLVALDDIAGAALNMHTVDRVFDAAVVGDGNVATDDADAVESILVRFATRNA